MKRMEGGQESRPGRVMEDYNETSRRARKHQKHEIVSGKKNVILNSIYLLN